MTKGPMYEDLMKASDRRDEPRPPAQLDPATSRVVLWTAVGGTMVVIVALWVLLLPTQLGRRQGEPPRWSAARVGEEDESPDLMESIRLYGKKLEALERHLNAEARSAASINDLRTKIEAAGKRNSAQTEPATTGQPGQPAPPTNADTTAR